jgi:hypothetical protein
VLKLLIYTGIIALVIVGALLFHPADLLWLGIVFAIMMALRFAGEKWARPAGAVFLSGLCYFAAFAWLSPMRLDLLPFIINAVWLWSLFIVFALVTILSLLVAIRQGFFRDFSREFIWAWLIALTFLVIAIVMNLTLSPSPQPLPLLLGILALLGFVGLRNLPAAAKGWFIPILAIIVLMLGGGRMLYGGYLGGTVWKTVEELKSDPNSIERLQKLESLIPYDREYKLNLAEFCVLVGDMDSAEKALERSQLLKGNEGRYDAIKSAMAALRGDWGTARLYQDMAINMDSSGKDMLWREVASRLGLDLVQIKAMLSAHNERWWDAAIAMESKADPSQLLLVGRLYWEGNHQKEARERLSAVALWDDLDGITARLALEQKIKDSRIISWQQMEHHGGMEVHMGWNISYDGVSTEVELATGDRIWVKALGWGARGIWPVMDVWVDGELFQQVYVEGHLYWPYLLDPVPAGKHSIKFSFANDISVEGGFDRNLTLDGIYIVNMAQ